MARTGLDPSMAINGPEPYGRNKSKNHELLNVDISDIADDPKRLERKVSMFDEDHPRRNCLLPKEIYEHIADGGQAKLEGSFLREFVLGLIAGAFICFGYTTCMIAAGQLSPAYRKQEPGMFNLIFGAYGFPVGLSMCVINGASLFTSNIAYMMAAFIEKKVTAVQALWVVWMSYFTNLAGCLMLVGLMYKGDVFLHREAFTIELAHKKCSYSFGATLIKGILCNWLVCIAVWQGNAAEDIVSKLLGIWFPISAFVTCGYEHCVANMFVIPLAIKLGADITVRQFLVKNLIPATIGNLIGGGFFVATCYGLAYGKWEKDVCMYASRLWMRHAPSVLTPRASAGSHGGPKSPYHPMAGARGHATLPKG